MMQLRTNLQQGSNSLNYAFSSCCDSEFEVFLELEPGDSDHEVTSIDILSNGGCNIQILEVGGIPYTTPFAPSTSVTLSPTFVLFQGNSLSVKIKYCPCAVGSGNDYLVFTVNCNQHPLAPHYFDLNVYALDPALWTSPGLIIRETTPIAFSDCLNDCGSIKDVIHLHNPSSFPVFLTAGTTPGFVGFNFKLAGNDIDIYNGFWMPPGDSVIQMSNPNCLVPPNTNFDLVFTMCGLALPVVQIYHIQNYCTTCGLDCASVQINTNHPAPIETICPDYNGDSVSPNWIAIGTSGLAPSHIVYSSINVKIDWTVGPGPTQFQFANDVYYTYTPNFNTTDHVTLFWEFETGDTSISGLQLIYDGTAYGIGYQFLGYLYPNTRFSGTIDIPSFVAPLPATPYNAGLFLIQGNIIVDDYIEIKTAKIKLQQYNSVALIPQNNLSCSNLQIYNETSVGDYKEVEFNLYYQNGFQDNVQVNFNPFLFGQTANFAQKYPSGSIDSPPQTGFMYLTMATDIGAGPKPMLYAGHITQLNFKCTIELIDNYNFVIRFSFYIIEDVFDWITTANVDTDRRLTYASTDDYHQYLALYPSVFREDRLFGALIYIYDTNIVTSYDLLGNPLTYYECYLDKKVYFNAAYWDYGHTTYGMNMFNPQWKLERNSNIVTNLSTLSSTEVTFEINCYDGVDNIIFWLFDTNNTTNAQDFYVDLDSSRALIGTITSAGQLDRHLYSPSQGSTNIGGTTYQAKVTINNSINANGNYHIGAICYSSASNQVYSFLKKNISVTSLLSVNDVCCPMDVDSHWYDYTTDENHTCFSGTVKERVNNTMTINGGAFESCLNALGVKPGKPWLSFMTQVFLITYIRKDNYPSIGQSTYFVYDAISSTRNGAVAGNWINTDPRLTIFDDNITLTSTYEDRVRWEDTVFDPNNVLTGSMSAYYDRFPAGPTNGALYVNNFNINNSWGGQQIYYEYNFVFDLTQVIPTSQPFILTQMNRLKVFDFEPVSAPDVQYMLPLVVEGYDGSTYKTLNSFSFCTSNYQHLRITSELTNGLTDGMPLVVMSYYPYNNANLQEKDASGPYTPIVSLNTASLVYDIDLNYSSGIATCKIDCANLHPGSYQLCVIRQNI